MKKTFMLLAALMLFVACSKDEEPAIDYSTWTTEELLADPNGIDYLVKTAGEVNYDALNEQLKTLVLVSPDAHGWYTYKDGKWECGTVIGTDISFNIMMEDGTFRKCAEQEFPPFDVGYDTYPLSDNPIVDMIKKHRSYHRIIAVVGQTIIVENERDPQKRARYSLIDCRQWVLDTFTRSWDEVYEERRKEAQ